MKTRLAFGSAMLLSISFAACWDNAKQEWPCKIDGQHLFAANISQALASGWAPQMIQLAELSTTCGDIVCADSQTQARAKFVQSFVDHGYPDPGVQLLVFDLGTTFQSATAGAQQAIKAWQCNGAVCLPQPQPPTADAGTWAMLGETCVEPLSTTAGNGLPCCSTETLTNGAVIEPYCGGLIYGQDFATGVCCIPEGESCVSDDQCCDGAVCDLTSTCCQPAGATCYPEYPDDCCSGDCEPDDTTSTGYACQ